MPQGAKLIVVESPSKAKTINKYLGNEYVVEASVGHIKNLPKSKLGIDVENGFKLSYETIKGKDEVIEKLRNHAAKASAIYLATDPDREGEAIAWHLKEAA
ncbi:MAG: toprim domain-containing protein, partial [Bacteroidota bacterium]